MESKGLRVNAVVKMMISGENAGSITERSFPCPVHRKGEHSHSIHGKFWKVLVDLVISEVLVKKKRIGSSNIKHMQNNKET